MNNIRNRGFLLLVFGVVSSLHADQKVVTTARIKENIEQQDLAVTESQAYLNEQLGYAVWFNNDDEIRNLINQGADPNALCVVGDIQFYPLAGVLEKKGQKQWSSRQKSGNQDFELVKFLVEHGADIEKNSSVFASAIMLGNYAIVQFLLDRGINIEIKVAYGAQSLGIFDFLINGIDVGHSYADVMLIIVALVDAVVKIDPKVSKNALTTGVLTACTKKIKVLKKLEEAAKRFEKRNC